MTQQFTFFYLLNDLSSTMNRIHTILIVGGVILSVSVFSSSTTQAATEPVPREETPGAAGRAFEETKPEKEKELEDLGEKIQEAVVDAKAVASQEQAVQIEEQVETFYVKEIKVTGNTTFSGQQLKPIVFPYQDKTLSLNDLTELTHKLTLFYKSQGYVTSRAYVPAQRLEEGILEVRVLEGKLGQIEIEGNRYFKDEQLRKNIEIESGQVVSLPKLEEDLNYINIHPDRKAKVVLLPGDQPETIDFKLDVKDRPPLHANFSAHNSGTDSTGRWRFEPRAAHNNLLGFDDILSVRYQLGKNIGIGAVGYQFPINRRSQVGLSYSRVDLELGDEFSLLEIKGHAETFGISAQHLFYDGPRWDFALGGGFDVKNIKNESLGISLGKDELRVLSLTPMLRGQDSHGRTVLANSFQFGIPDFLGGSADEDPDSSRLGTGGEFFKYGISLARMHLFPSDYSAILRFNSQLTSDKLVAAEQFRLGGFNSVRGYEEGEFLGDKGFLAGVELRTLSIPLRNLTRRALFEDTSGPQVQFLTFLEGGRATFSDPAAGQKGNETLLGAGLGMRVKLFEHFGLRADWGVPLEETAKSGSGEFYFGLDTDF